MTDYTAKMSKLKTYIVLEDPFFSTILLHMAVVYDKTVPVAATNGHNLLINPDTFFKCFSEPEQRFILYHEVMHVAIETMHLFEGRNPQVLNIASDVIINHLLKKDICSRSRGIAFPKGIIDDDDLAKEGKTQVGVYNILMDRLEKSGQAEISFSGPEGDGEGEGEGQGDGDGGDELQRKVGVEGKRIDEVKPDPGKTKGERQSNRMKQKVMVQQAVQAHHMAKRAGKENASIMRAVDDSLEAKMPWHEILRDFVVRQRDDTRSWQRMNRRFLPQSIYAPSQSGECLGPVMVAVDCSGSICDRELSAYAAEIRSIHEDMRPSRMDVIYFSHQVTHVDSYGPEDEIEIGPKGGGGTAFSPIFRHALNEDMDPACAVVLTDMYCDDFGAEPDYPVMWISTTGGDHKPPFGTVIPMDP